MNVPADTLLGTLRDYQDVREKMLVMGYFYFTRHGQTVWNVENKICGVTDIELTERGHRQAAELAERILRENIYIDEIICSPLRRAADTARHISEITGVPMRVEPRLKEQNFGQRIYNLLDDIRQEADAKVYLMVAHNGVARAVQSYFTDMTNEGFALFGIKNCELRRYDF